jgi:hypothetical protein
LVQGIGAVFYGVFSSAYMLALPSSDLLHGEPIFKLLLSIWGGLFLILIFVAIALSMLLKKDD